MLRCRSWQCQECAEERARQLKALAHSGAPNTFLTLTSRRRPGITPAHAAKQLAWCWRVIRLRLMRQAKTKHLPFIAVFEATKLGWPHLHILLRSRWIDQKQLSEWMAELHDSPIVYIERIDNRARLNAYVAKYAGKAAHKFGTTKRYWTSQDWRLEKAKPDKKPVILGGGYERERTPIAKLVTAWQELGWRVQWLTRWRAHATVMPIGPGP